MIEVRNLVKRYGDNYAVNDISFTVEKGKIYGFLGPNGAGKSTAMNIITGYIAATSGQVLINGHDILEEPLEAKKCIGYLPEQPPVYMDMTVWEYLLFAASVKKIEKSRKKAQVEEAMRRVSIGNMRNRLIKNLSKGYRQRVGLAQALLGDPEVFILDEPSVGLDPKQIIEMRNLIKSLANGHTVILSSHILSEVSAVCDKILIISRGKLVASDSAEHLGRLMADHETLELTVIGNIEKVAEVMKKLSGIPFAAQPAGEEGRVKVTVRCITERDVRAEVSLALAQERIAITAMNTNSPSLEDIFLKLTSAPLRNGGENK